MTPLDVFLGAVDDKLGDYLHDCRVNDLDPDADHIIGIIRAVYRDHSTHAEAMALGQARSMEDVAARSADVIHEHNELLTRKAAELRRLADELDAGVCGPPGPHGTGPGPIGVTGAGWGMTDQGGHLNTGRPT